MHKFSMVAVVCAGAPLLALGVGTATASADTTTTTTTAAHTAKGPTPSARAHTAKGPTPSVAAQTADGWLAISVSGQTLVQIGNSTAESTPGPNLAIAYNNSHAGAFVFGNLAIASNNSTAVAAGILNTAIADNNSSASVQNPFVPPGLSFSTIGNTAIARDGSTARVLDGSFNSVTARCGGSVVISGSNQNVTSAPCETG